MLDAVKRFDVIKAAASQMQAVCLIKSALPHERFVGATEEMVSVNTFFHIAHTNTVSAFCAPYRCAATNTETSDICRNRDNGRVLVACRNFFLATRSANISYENPLLEMAFLVLR